MIATLGFNELKLTKENTFTIIYINMSRMCLEYYICWNILLEYIKILEYITYIRI